MRRCKGRRLCKFPILFTSSVYLPEKNKNACSIFNNNNHRDDGDDENNNKNNIHIYSAIAIVCIVNDTEMMKYYAFGSLAICSWKGC